MLIQISRCNTNGCINNRVDRPRVTPRKKKYRHNTEAEYDECCDNALNCRNADQFRKVITVDFEMNIAVLCVFDDRFAEFGLDDQFLAPMCNRPYLRAVAAGDNFVGIADNRYFPYSLSVKAFDVFFEPGLIGLAPAGHFLDADLDCLCQFTRLRLKFLIQFLFKLRVKEEQNEDEHTTEAQHNHYELHVQREGEGMAVRHKYTIPQVISADQEVIALCPCFCL